MICFIICFGGYRSIASSVIHKTKLNNEDFVCSLNYRYSWVRIEHCNIFPSINFYIASSGKSYFAEKVQQRCKMKFGHCKLISLDEIAQGQGTYMFYTITIILSRLVFHFLKNGTTNRLKSLGRLHWRD